MPLASETSVKVTIVSVGTPCECASAGDGSAERRVVIVRIAIIIAVFLGRLIGFIPIMDTPRSHFGNINHTDFTYEIYPHD